MLEEHTNEMVAGLFCNLYILLLDFFSIFNQELLVLIWVVESEPVYSLGRLFGLLSCCFDPVSNWGSGVQNLID